MTLVILLSASNYKDQKNVKYKIGKRSKHSKERLEDVLRGGWLVAGRSLNVTLYSLVYSPTFKSKKKSLFKNDIKLIGVRELAKNVTHCANTVCKTLCFV